MKAWIAAAGGVAVAAVIVAACARQAPQSPSTLEEGSASGDAKGKVSAQESPVPTFPSHNPIPNTAPSPGQVPTAPSPGTNLPTSPHPGNIPTSPNPGDVPTSPHPGSPLPGPNPGTNPGGGTPPGGPGGNSGTPSGGGGNGGGGGGSATLAVSISTVGDFTARVMNDGFVGTFKPYLDENHVWSGGDTLDPDFLPHSTLVRTEFADRTLTNDPAMTVRFTSGVELGKAPVNAIVEMCVYVDGSTPSSPSTWLPTRGFVRSSNSKPDLLSETGARISSVDEWCKSFGTGTSASQELGPAVVPPLVAPRMMYFVAVRLRGLFAPVPVAPRNGQP